METQALIAIAADAILVAHVAFAAFVVLGVVLVFAGKFLSWRWVRNPWFRYAHLTGTGVIVLQSWAGLICPLTIWEMELRSKAGEFVYEGSFISFWLHKLLYYEAPPWVFALVYTVFGALVLASWIWVRPRPFSATSPPDISD